MKRRASSQVDARNTPVRQRRVATGITSSTAGCNATRGANASSTNHAKRAAANRRRASVTAGIWWTTSPSDEVLMNRMSCMEPLTAPLEASLSESESRGDFCGKIPLLGICAEAAMALSEIDMGRLQRGRHDVPEMRAVCIEIG